VRLKITFQTRLESHFKPASNHQQSTNKAPFKSGLQTRLESPFKARHIAPHFLLQAATWHLRIKCRARSIADVLKSILSWTLSFIVADCGMLSTKISHVDCP
jgi:hypothetical protein